MSLEKTGEDVVVPPASSQPVAREQHLSHAVSSKAQTGLSKRNIRRQYDGLMKEAGHLLFAGKIKCVKCGTPFQMDESLTSNPTMTSNKNLDACQDDPKTLKLSKEGGGRKKTGEPGLASPPGSKVSFQVYSDKEGTEHPFVRPRRLTLTPPPAPRNNQSKNISGFTSPLSLKSFILKNKDSIDIYKDEEPVKITKSSCDENLSHQIVKEARSITQDERHSFVHSTFTSKAQESTYSTFTSSTPLAYNQRDSGNNFKCSEISMKWGAPLRGSMDGELCEDEDSLLIPRFRRSNLLSDLDLYNQDSAARSENDYFLLNRRVSVRSLVYPTKLLNTISEEGSSEQNSESHQNSRLQPPPSSTLERTSIVRSDKTSSLEKSNLMRRLSEQRRTIPRLSPLILPPSPKSSQPSSNIDKENLRPGQLGFPSSTGLTTTNQAIPIRNSAQKKPLLSIFDQENISKNENSTQDHSNNKLAPLAAVKPFVGHNKNLNSSNKENMRKTDKNTPEKVTLFIQNKLNTSSKLSCDLNTRESTLIQSPKISDISYIQIKKVSIKSIGMELFGIDTPLSNRKHGRPEPLGVSSQMVQEIERLRESKNKSLVKKSQIKDSGGLNALCQSSKSKKETHSSFEQDDKLNEIKGRPLKSQGDDSVSKSCLNKPLKISKFDKEKYSSIEATIAAKPKETKSKRRTLSKSRGVTLKSQTKGKDSVNLEIVKEKIESEELLLTNEEVTSIPVEEDVSPRKRLHGTANADLTKRISTFPTENEDGSTCNPGLPRRSCRLKLKSLRGDKPAPSRSSVILEERKSIRNRTFSTRSKKSDLSHISTILAPSKFDPFNHEALEGLLKDMGFPKPHHADSYFVLNTNLPKGVRTMKIDNKCFRLVKELSQGSSSSKVVKAVSPEGDLVALKIVKPSSSWEYYILKELQTRGQDNRTFGFVDVRAAFIYKNGCILETPYAKFGSLNDVINTFEKSTGAEGLDSGVVLHFSLELTSIIEHLHKCQIIHANLRGNNIVLFDLPDPEEAKPCLRLIDFGRSIDMSLFPTGSQFQVPPFKKENSTIVTREKKPWSYQIDLEGLASVIYLLLGSEPLEVEKRSNLWQPRRPLPICPGRLFCLEMFSSQAHLFPFQASTEGNYEENTIKIGGHAISNLPLQVALYFNVVFFPFWLITCVIMVSSKFDELCRLYQFIFCLSFATATVLEVIRLYVGYVGNLKEKISELAGFWLITILLQTPLQLFLLLSTGLQPSLLQIIVQLVMCSFLVVQLISGVFALRKAAKHSLTLLLAASYLVAVISTYEIDSFRD